MRKFVLFYLLLFAAAYSFAQTKNFIDQPYLETNARADTLVTPDRIYLNITITEKDSKGRNSVEEQENKMARSFRNLGIDLDKQLVIDDLSSSFKKYFLRQKDVLKSKRYVLLVYTGKQAAQALVALEELDIANTYLQKTEYSKMDALELDLKSKAVIKAKKKAVALTTPLGQKVGIAIHISDTSTPYYPRYNERAELKTMAMDAMGEPEPLDLDFEKIKVETAVDVKFILE
ncbi:hypothetical protein GGR42_002205 [Saonia flava]|uniref:SIMPL domain-containing protein n=1 Tax=Saonia flava TaxID=523696 RepID=A0A846QZY3_9FLAO|nr:SIMPL domain-containing protein [Saonia flava]NJB71743.1 hypothetical protein [Saonia flava]